MNLWQIAALYSKLTDEDVPKALETAIELTIEPKTCSWVGGFMVDCTVLVGCRLAVWRDINFGHPRTIFPVSNFLCSRRLLVYRRIIQQG